jgi:hypothetical protein
MKLHAAAVELGDGFLELLSRRLVGDGHFGAFAAQPGRDAQAAAEAPQAHDGYLLAAPLIIGKKQAGSPPESESGADLVDQLIGESVHQARRFGRSFLIN